MPNVRCVEKREYVARLPTFVVFLKLSSALSTIVNFYMVLDRPFDIFLFVENLGRYERGHDCNRRLRIAHLPLFKAQHIARMFATPPSSRSLFYASVLVCCSGCECR